MFGPNLDKFLAENRHSKIVFTNGCFDILHRGHVEYLMEARALGDVLIIGLNSDASVKKLKGPERPLNPEQDRKIVLENLRVVNFVQIFDQDTPLELIKYIQPNVLVKGGDWSVSRIVGSDIVLANGGIVKSLKFLNGFSTTNIINRIKAD